jgi:hypothetical protein
MLGSLVHTESQIFDPIENPWNIIFKIRVAKVKGHPTDFK